MNHDANGRVLDETTTINGVDYLVGYTYDGRGRVETMTYPSGRTIAYEYDAASRVTKIDGFVTSASYHPSGAIAEERYANGVSTKVVLDELQRVQQLNTAGVHNLNYSYDAVGNVLSSNNRTTSSTGPSTGTFDYDALDRMTDASGSWGTRKYSYNAVGDRMSDQVDGESTSYSYSNEGALNSLSGRTELTYGYDGFGNVIRRGSYRYRYDNENRLIAVLDADSRVQTQFGYNGRGQRVLIQSAGCGGYAMIYDHSGNRIAESTLAGLLLKEMVYSNGRTIAHLDYVPLKVETTSFELGDVDLGFGATVSLRIHNRSGEAMTINEQTSVRGQVQLANADPVTIGAGQSVDMPLNLTVAEAGPFADTLALCTADGVRLAVRVSGRAGNLSVATGTPANGDAVDATGAIAAQFRRQLEQSSVTANSFVVHALQSGLVAGSIQFSGGQITFVPNGPFKAGEPIQISATGQIQYEDGSSVERPTVWQLRAKPPAQNTGGFTDLVQSASAVQSASTVQTDFVPKGFALGDLDGDGDLDIFAANYNTQTGRGPNFVWINDGRGSFSDSGQRLGNRWSTSVALGDLDNDGDLDAFVTNETLRRAFTDEQANTVWFNDGAGNFSDSGQLLGNNESSAVALGDLDGDGDLDAVVANSNVNGANSNMQPFNRVWINDGAGQFTLGNSLGTARTLDITIGDVDNDGDLDIFAANYSTNSPSQVWLNQGDGTFQRGAQLERLIRRIELADLDSDGDLDMLGDGAIYLNDGSGTFVLGFALSTPLGGTHALGDLDGDGDLDIYAQSSATDPDSVWFNDGSGQFAQGILPLGGVYNTVDTQVADIDGDGDLDIVQAPDRVRTNGPGRPSTDLNEKSYLPLVARE